MVLHGAAGRAAGCIARYAGVTQTRGVDFPASEQDGSLYPGRGRCWKVRGLAVSLSYFEWSFANRRLKLPNGGLRWLYTEDGLFQFDPPRMSSACEAATLGDESDGCLSGPKKIVMKLQVNWGHASGQQLERVSLDFDGNNMRLLTCADEVLGQCEVCQAFDTALHAPIAGPSTVAMSNEKLLFSTVAMSPRLPCPRLQADLLFSDDIIALRKVDVPPRCARRIPVRAENPREDWGAFHTSGIGVPALAQCIRMDDGGERENEVCTELRSERSIKLLLQGVGAHPGILERRNILARGICNR